MMQYYRRQASATMVRHLVFTLCIFHQAAGRIILTPSPETKCINDSISLKWQYDSPSDMSTLRWKKDAKSVLTFNVGLGNIPDPHYNGRVSYHQSNGSFMLRGLFPNDTGNYTMEVSYYNNPPDSSHVELYVYEYIETSIKITVIERHCNGTLLRCTIPNEENYFSYQWTDLNGQTISSNDTLFATCGIFTCTISGGATKCMKKSSKTYQTFRVTKCQCNGQQEFTIGTILAVVFACFVFIIIILCLAHLVPFYLHWKKIKKMTVNAKKITKESWQSVERNSTQHKEYYAKVVSSESPLNESNELKKKMAPMLRGINEEHTCIESQKNDDLEKERKTMKYWLLSRCFPITKATLMDENAIDNILSRVKDVISECEKRISDADTAIDMKQILDKTRQCERSAEENFKTLLKVYEEAEQEFQRILQQESITKSDLETLNEKKEEAKATLHDMEAAKNEATTKAVEIQKYDCENEISNRVSKSDDLQHLLKWHANALRSIVANLNGKFNSANENTNNICQLIQKANNVMETKDKTDTVSFSLA